MISGLEQSHAGTQDRRHTRRRTHALLRPLESCYPLLESAHRRIGVARIHIAGLLTAKSCSGFFGRGENVAGGGKNRLRVLAFAGALNTRPDGQRIQLRTIKSAVIIPAH